MTAATKPARMTAPQAETARRILASPDGRLHYMTGGTWSVAPHPPAPGERPIPHEWSTTVPTLRRMEAAGWLERTHEDSRAYADARRLTPAGQAALAAFDAQAEVRRQREAGRR